jgi:transposase
MDIFMEFVSKEFKEYRIIMVMDGASWHRGDKMKKWENIVPLFQPPYSPEVNPIESLWHHIREKGKFKNTTFHSLGEVENRLVQVINALDKDTLKSITLFNWIKAVI